MNSQSLLSKFDEIRDFMIGSQPLAMSLTETRVTEDISDFELSIQGYQTFRVDSDNRHTGGVIIYIKDCVNVLKVEKYQYQKNYWFILVNIEVSHKVYILGNLYHSPSASNSEFLNFFEKWCNDLDDNGHQVLIMGDFNINWLSDDFYSKKLKKLVNDVGLNQVVEEITHPTDQGGSVIDLVFSNRPDLLECSVLETPRIGDHFIVSVSIGSGKSVRQDVIINTRGRINYGEINNRLSRINWDFRIRDMDTKYNIFYNNLINVLNQVAPRQEKIIKARYKEWFNDRIRNAIKERDDSYKNYKENNTNYSKEEYKRCRNKVVMTIREEKKIFYQTKIEFAKNQPKKMWQTLSELVSDKKKKKINRLEIDSKIIMSSKEMSEQFNEYFVESINEIVQDINKNYTVMEHLEKRTGQQTINSFQLIDYKQLKDILFSLPNKGSPDDITAEFLKSTYENIREPLLNLINSSFETGKIPSLLKVSTVIPVQKCKGAVKADDFRPVNMLATVEKVLERAVYIQLVDFVNRNNILYENQSGFRKFHSCETAMQNILFDWKELLDDNYAIGAVFLDLRRAFETVDRKILVKKLQMYGIQNQALQWLIDYLDNRKQVTKVNEEISDVIVNNNGVPQGSTLGPLLFLIYVNDISGMVSNCFIHLFADDTLVCFFSKDLENLVQTLNLELGQLDRWFNENSLKLNVNKTKFMLIANSKIQKDFKQSNFGVKINDEYIEMVEKIKYLGFVVDGGLTFKDHILFIIDKITKNINFLARTSRSLTQWTKMTIYNTLVLPHLVFSSSILYLANKNEMGRLQKLQNRAMRLILGEKRETPIKSMLDRLNWLPVEKFLQYQIMILIYKIRNGLTPNYLTKKLVTNDAIHSYPTRNRHDFHIFAKNKSSSENALYHKGLILFNSLPDNVKNINNLNLFKTKLKKKLRGE